MTAVFAVIALALALVSSLVDYQAADIWGVAVSLLAVIAAIVLNVVPFGSWEQSHRDLFRQWTGFREDADSLESDLAGEPTSHDLCALSKLEARSHRVCGQEVSPDDKRVRSCYRAETKSRQFSTPAPA